MKPIRKVEMENTTDGHFKVWIGELMDDDTVICSWGAIDAENLQSKSFPKAGEKFFNKKIAEKIKKGYEIV